MTKLTRRKALMLGGMAVLATKTAAAQSNDVRVRENIMTFAKDEAKVTAYRAGVRKMMDRSKANADDPEGWYYWYASHFTNKAVPPAMQGIYNRCDHSDPRHGYIAQDFLSWHRAFLLAFEGVLKDAAVAAGNRTEFNLPYWNWYEGPVPSIFTEGNEIINPLYHARVSTNVAAGLAHDCFDQMELLTSGDQPGFSLIMEFDPHGRAHTLVGGDMQTIPRSAQDPIFWVHHANIDRLWDSWIQLPGRKNPDPASAWAKKKFAFGHDPNMVWTASELLDTKTNLKYVYDDYKINAPGAPVAPAPAIVLAGTAGGGAMGGGMAGMLPEVWNDPTRSTDVASFHNLKLSNQSVAVSLPVASADRSHLQAFAVNSEAGPVKSAWIVLNDIRITPDGKEGGFVFSVRLTSSLPGVKPVTIGDIPSFNLTMPMAGIGDITNGDPFSITYPLDDYATKAGIDPAKLGEALGSLKVNFIAALSKPDDTRTLMTVGEVKLTTSPLSSK